MLKKRIIPCLDIRGGRVVKGIKFQNLRDAGDPVEQARRYDADGADELVILDVSATHEERLATLSTIEAVREHLTIPLTVGGGVRSLVDAKRLLDSGADKVSVNSAAVERPELIKELAQQFGAQCTVVAIDAARCLENAADKTSWQVVSHSGTRRHQLDAISWACTAESFGAGEILLTSWDRDGTGTGYDLGLLSQLTSQISLPVIASGGAKSIAHMFEAFNHGAHAVLAASIFHDGHMDVLTVKRELSAMGIPVRIDHVNQTSQSYLTGA
ncbi:MAG TPA: imidazole glycerol phosphate synthase subunit HisF [Pirellulaceae bacterium]|nr:imidazole glycerol phosphate synthase subunit HisF [Pirellulaceae bacterium]HMO92382.1 imidazole glycerol phosphate synthase subunit HisF [Pirellulaceae bacterium]HMP70755.1 imidazole glycerol phosphate synthase subunit HisF [Pirellulaceae bacterium]